MGFNSGFKVLNAVLNPICHLLALLGAHPILHISSIRVNIEQLHFTGYIQGVFLYFTDKRRLEASVSFYYSF